MAINLARMGAIRAPEDDGFSYDPADEARKNQLARDIRKKSAQDLRTGEIDLAAKALAQRELERTTKEAEQARGIRSGYIVSREGALDLPVGVRSPEFINDQRPSNAPFGPMGAPAQRSPMETRTTIDLARVNPDLAEQFRTGNLTERNSSEDRARKMAGEDQTQIQTGATFAELKNKNASDAKHDADVLAEATRNNRAQNNIDWFKAKQAGAKPVKPTADQNNLANYGRRLMQAEQDFQTIEASGGDRTSAGAAFKNAVLPNAAQPELLQKQNQAERNFLTAVLRRESGAVISPTEFKEGSKQYFPRFGDSKAVLEQKRRNRQLVQESFKNLSGPAWENAGGDVAGDPDYEEYLRLKAEAGQ